MPDRVRRDRTLHEALKAVEAVACPAVLPTNATATLGKVRDHLRDADAKWELVRRQNQDGAEAVVHLAATLVQWSTSGALRRRAP
jgi:hypothetical protein